MTGQAGQIEQLLRAAWGHRHFFDEEFNTEAWDIGNGVRIFLDYDDVFKKIRLIQIGLVPVRDMIK
ncbi:hypothetical protein [Burkholderia ubonensis]|uniref:hypothetical protein n=1 Tax=Burkholderia ubonensis TaxID=101571 RepID=UPI000A6C2DB1|nr:hypothetical protein [Burkholderia ubonensis]